MSDLAAVLTGLAALITAANGIVWAGMAWKNRGRRSGGDPNAEGPLS
jgi:hypothetical protein